MIFSLVTMADFFASCFEHRASLEPIRTQQQMVPKHWHIAHCIQKKPRKTENNTDDYLNLQRNPRRCAQQINNDDNVDCCLLSRMDAMAHARTDTQNTQNTQIAVSYTGTRYTKYVKKSRVCCSFTGKQHHTCAYCFLESFTPRGLTASCRKHGGPSVLVWLSYQR